MVKGLNIFRDRFRQFEGSFTLIGGAACDEWFTVHRARRWERVWPITPSLTRMAPCGMLRITLPQISHNFAAFLALLAQLSSFSTRFWQRHQIC
jgi:hypothetical protein